MKNFFITVVALFVSATSGNSQSYSPGYNYDGGSYPNSYDSSVYSYESSNHNEDIDIQLEISGNSDTIDSVRAAKAFAQNFWEEFVVDVTYPNQNGGWHFMQAGMNLKGQVFELILDDKYVFRREEGILLPGLPLPKGGMKEVYVYVDGVIEDEPKVNGSAYFDKIKDGDRLSITLRPLHVIKHVPSNLSEFPSIPDDVDPFDIRLIDQSGNFIGYYYPWLQGFVMYVDPSRSPFYASIFIEGYDGNFGSILIDPLKQVTKKFKGASLDFNLLGNVVRITDNASGNQSYKMDGTTVGKSGEVEKAKAFIYDNSALSDVSFWVQAKAEHENVYMDINVYDVSDGEDNLIFQRTIVPRNISGQGQELYQLVNLPASSEDWESLVVVITTRNGDLQNDDLEFYLYQDYVPVPVYSGEAVIPEDGFQDEGSQSNNDDNTSRDFTFTFEATAVGGDVLITPDDVQTFVEGGSSFYSTQTVSSTAEEPSSGGYVIRENETETFTVVVTISNASHSGQYRVGLDSVGGVVVNRTKFRTAYRAINGVKG